MIPIVFFILFVIVIIGLKQKCKKEEVEWLRQNPSCAKLDKDLEK